MIGSTSLFGAGSTYQSVSMASVAKVNDKKNEANTANASDSLTDSQRFTQRNAGLSAQDYIRAYFNFAEQNSAELLKSGAATDTFAVRFEGRTFTLAGKKLDGLNFEAARLPGTVQVAKADDVSRTSAGQVDLMA